MASAVGGPPLNTYATDAKTVIGSDPDYASAIADSLGLELQIIPVAWADWPLGLTSGKYDAVISNVGVTEQRKEKFDFSSYRRGGHGFFVRLDSPLKSISEPKDAAGLRVIVGAGTNQERILLRWSQENVKAGLKPLELQYYDDEATQLIALQSGRADVIVQPHSTLVFIAKRDKNIRRVGILSAGWPEKSDVAITTRKGSGLANALTIATNGLIAEEPTPKSWNAGDSLMRRFHVRKPIHPDCRNIERLRTTHSLCRKRAARQPAKICFMSDFTIVRSSPVSEAARPLLEALIQEYDLRYGNLSHRKDGARARLSDTPLMLLRRHLVISC